MESSFTKDYMGNKLYNDAQEHLAKENHIKALELLEDVLSVHKEANDSRFLHLEQGNSFLGLAEKARNAGDPDLENTYLLGCAGCYSEHVSMSDFCAQAIYTLAVNLGSVQYYKKALLKAKEFLSQPNPDHSRSVTAMASRQLTKDKKKMMESLIEGAEAKIAASKTSPLNKPELKIQEAKKSPEPLLTDKIKRLKSYWLGLNVKIKRDFMKVSIEDLKSFVGKVHSKKARDALDELIASAKKDMKWTCWMCRTKCPQKCSSAVDCKNHLEDEHAADFQQSPNMDRVQRIGKDWARKILVGTWEPVDAVAAVEMIKNQLVDVRAFVSKSKNGWSKEWPLAADVERSTLLKELKTLLLSLSDKKILSGSIRDWLMRFPADHLGELAVSRQSLIDSRLTETPQSICFLECHELSQILDFLKTIKCERDDGTDLVCRTVEVFVGRTRVKEKIDFDTEFSFLLLDRRLLKSSNVPFDDDVKINVFDPDSHYAKAHAQGDDIISWLNDYSPVDKTFPRPIREHNPGLWVAVLKAIHLTRRTLRAKYAKKAQVLEYDAALTVVKNLCLNEDERRRNLQEDQWSRYASLLCDKLEERNPENTGLFLSVVRDVLEGPSHPIASEDCLNSIRERRTLSDDIVLKSVDLLKSVVIQKALRIDSKILLIDNLRISLLNNLTSLSAFDNRTYILQLLKPFLLNEIANMEHKIKSDAAEADLIIEEEKKKKLQSKKNKNTRNKRTSTSESSPLDNTVERFDPESTSPSVKPVEEDPIASEKGQSEISSRTQNQEEATKDDTDMQKLPGEVSLSEHVASASGEAATRYSSALDMTLKALLNIKVLKVDLQPFQDHLEEQVPPALQHLFTAFLSEVIKNEGVYSCLLSDLLPSLEEILSMSSDAATTVVAILDFWRSWKSQEKESLVTRLFTVAENERMTCRKCRRITYYPEQSSYVMAIAADSIRDLKCALGSIKFVEILKMVRMEYEKSCDRKTEGCGKTNLVHHILSRRPPIFTIVLEWEKNETEEEISETTKALEWEIDISKLYDGLEANTKYRLVSMVGWGEVEEEEHICLAYEKNRWVNLRRETLEGEDVGNWDRVVKYCGERKVRPEVLFYEAA